MSFGLMWITAPAVNTTLTYYEKVVKRVIGFLFTRPAESIVHIGVMFPAPWWLYVKCSTSVYLWFSHRASSRSEVGLFNWEVIHQLLFNFVCLLPGAAGPEQRVLELPAAESQ